jgi:uncharacterized protein (TIGR00266 family)
MESHEISYEVLGDDMQVVELELDPGEMVIAEAGAMNYMEDGIEYEARMGDGTHMNEGLLGKFMRAGMRMLSGESLFLTHFHNRANGPRRVAFAAPYPGKIIPLELSELGGEILCQKDAFLAAAYGTEVSIALNKRLGAGFFGGEGFILERLRGNGRAFLHVGGTVVKKELQGETLRVDTGCLAAFTADLDYNIEQAGNLRSMLFGGEGLFLATMRGHGTVWLQSLPFARLAERVVRGAMPTGNRGRKGEGSPLGMFGDLFGDR